MHGLDDIPWHTLHHAYGTAEDVPELLRQLQTADPDATNDSPLWQLFGNIWHQGTVYESTSYAVPFLVQLVEDPSTPNRVGILGLLAAIAHGASYLDVHEDVLKKYPVQKIGVPGTEGFNRKKESELAWVASARSAVAEGYEVYTALLDDRSQIAYAAANVLACLRVRSAETSGLLLDMLQKESRSRYRAGLLLLIGEHVHDSAEIENAVNTAATAELLEERRAAAIAASRRKSVGISPQLHDALIDAICDEDLDHHFEGLPWDASDNIDRDALFIRDPAASAAAVERLLATAEAGRAGEESYYTLCQLLFGTDRESDPLCLSEPQRRTVNAIIQAIDDRDMIFHTPLSCFGLPDSRRQLRRMAAGRPVDLKVDKKIPLIGDSANPARPTAVWKLKPGDRIHSRYFGLGTVIEVTPREYDVELVLDFDEEGRKTLGIDNSPLRYLADSVRYLWGGL